MLTPPVNPFAPEQYRAFQWVIDTLREHDRQLLLTGTNADNAGLQLNGSIDQLNRSVDELNATVTGLSSAQETLAATVAELTNRATHQVSPSSLTVSGNATVAPFPSSSRSFSFPAPQGGRRSAILAFSCELTSSSSSIAASIFPELFQDTARIWGGEPAQVPRMTSAPAGWTESVNGFAAVRVPAGSAPSFTFRMHRVGFQSTSTTITASNMQAVLMYGDIY